MPRITCSLTGRQLDQWADYALLGDLLRLGLWPPQMALMLLLLVVLRRWGGLRRCRGRQICLSKRLIPSADGFGVVCRS